MSLEYISNHIYAFVYIASDKTLSSQHSKLVLFTLIDWFVYQSLLAIYRERIAEFIVWFFEIRNNYIID